MFETNERNGAGRLDGLKQRVLDWAAGPIEGVTRWKDARKQQLLDWTAGPRNRAVELTSEHKRNFEKWKSHPKLEVKVYLRRLYRISERIILRRIIPGEKKKLRTIQGKPREFIASQSDEFQQEIRADIRLHRLEVAERCQHRAQAAGAAAGTPLENFLDPRESEYFEQLRQDERNVSQNSEYKEAHQRLSKLEIKVRRLRWLLERDITRLTEINDQVGSSFFEDSDTEIQQLVGALELEHANVSEELSQAEQQLQDFLQRRPHFEEYHEEIEELNSLLDIQREALRRAFARERKRLEWYQVISPKRASFIRGRVLDKYRVRIEHTRELIKILAPSIDPGDLETYNQHQQRMDAHRERIRKIEDDYLFAHYVVVEQASNH